MPRPRVTIRSLIPRHPAPAMVMLAALVAITAHAQESPGVQREWNYCVPGTSPVAARIAWEKHGSLFVLDRGASRVLKYSPEGELLTSWGGTGKGPGQFRHPVDIAVDERGFLYVADFDNQRIQKFKTSDGTYVSGWSTAPSFVSDIAADKQGNVYATNLGDDDILKYSPEGALIDRWPVGLPWTVSVDGSGYVYAVLGAGELVKHSSSGRRIWTVDLERYDENFTEDPSVLSSGPSGYVFVSQRPRGRTMVFTADGLLERWWAGSRNGIAEDDDGNLYVAGACSIRKLVLDRNRGQQRSDK